LLLLRPSPSRSLSLLATPRSRSRCRSPAMPPRAPLQPGTVGAALEGIPTPSTSFQGSLCFDTKTLRYFVFVHVVALIMALNLGTLADVAPTCTPRAPGGGYIQIFIFIARAPGPSTPAASPPIPPSRPPCSSSAVASIFVTKSESNHSFQPGYMHSKTCWHSKIYSQSTGPGSAQNTTWCAHTNDPVNLRSGPEFRL
jgi:hypothetical protein